MMEEHSKRAFDWKTFIASTIVTVIVSSPSWVPVFGGEYVDFGAALWAGLIGFSPVIFMAAGFIIGWNVRNSQAKKEREALETAHAEELSGIERHLGMSVDEAAAKLQERADHDATVWGLEEQRDALGSQCSYLAQQNENLEQALADLGCVTRSKDPNPHGLSKRALNAWNLMEERDKRSLGCLMGASVLRGTTPLFPLVMDMDGSLASIGLDTSMVKSLEALGILERYPQRALQPIRETDEMRPLLDGVDVCRGEAFFSTPEGIYVTEGCTAQFCVPGDFASPKMQCVDLGLYGYTDIGQELLQHVDLIKSPGLFSYLDKAYSERRDAEQAFSRRAVKDDCTASPEGR